MTHKLTFELDPYSRKSDRYLLWLLPAAVLLVLALIALQLHSLALGILLLTLVLSGVLLRRFSRRYQALPLVKEKHELQQEADRLREKVLAVETSLTETKARREHLLHKEQNGLQATLLNQQLHHIQKGLASYFIRDEALSALVPELKERLAAAGILTALDLSDEAVSQIAELDPANREALIEWRTSLYAQFDATKPVKLPDHQLEYIQKKFNRLHARNDEKERALSATRQQFEEELHTTQQRLHQLSSITFRGYIGHILSPG